MTHRRLFAVEVRHDYFGGGASPDLLLRPTAAAARDLARHRLLARPRPDGLEVIAPVDAGGDPVVRLAPDLRLALSVHVTAPAFFHYTADAALAGAPTFRGSAPGELARAAGGPVPAGVAATVEVAGLAATWLADPPKFVLRLAARAPLWAYYAFTRRAGDIAPELRDEDLGRGLAFTRVPLTADRVTPADDPVGHRLAARSDGRRGFRFTSEQPIPGRRAPLRQLALYLGGELVLRDLSNPAIDSRTTLKVESTAETRETLFRVIEY